MSFNIIAFLGYIVVTIIAISSFFIVDDIISVNNNNCPNFSNAYGAANMILIQSSSLLIYGITLINCAHKKNKCCVCPYINQECGNKCYKMYKNHRSKELVLKDNSLDCVCCDDCECCIDCQCCNERCFRCCSPKDQWIYLSILLVLTLHASVYVTIMSKSEPNYQERYYEESYVVITMLFYHFEYFMVFILTSSLLIPVIYNLTSLFACKQMILYLLIFTPTFIISIISSAFIHFPGFVLLGIPILFMMAMNEIKILKDHWFEIIGIYISLLDLFTDILVAKEYLAPDDDTKSKHVNWGIIQIMLSVIAQIISCIDMYSIGIISSLFSLVGLGRPLIVIQTWFYPELSSKLSSMKTWELFYESLPSFSFQLYILLAQLHDNQKNRIKDAIIPSIMVVILNTSLTMWMYIVLKTSGIKKEPLNSLQMSQSRILSKSSLNDKKEQEIELFANIDNDNDNNSKLFDDYKHIYTNVTFFLILLMHLFCDFFTRVYPLINISIIIHIINERSSIKSDILFIIPFIIIISISIYSYAMSLYMKRSKKFIFTIFFVLIYSSFYNMLCTIKALKSDKFFGLTLDYNDYKREFRQRMLISVILYSVS